MIFNDNVLKQIKLYCENLELRVTPTTNIYFGVTKRDGLLVGVGINQETFTNFEELNLYYYETTAFKYLLYYEIITRKITKYPLFIKFSIAIMTNLNLMNIEEHLSLLGITPDEYNDLTSRKISEVGSNRTYTRKDLFKYFMIDDELTLDFFKTTNLISKIEFEDIYYD
ncbi:MAG: hypothetical protein R3Y05_05945 [bacterium]